MTENAFRILFFVDFRNFFSGRPENLGNLLRRDYGDLEYLGCDSQSSGIMND